MKSQVILPIALYSLAVAALQYTFNPDNAASFRTPGVPTLYDLTESQFETALSSSYYVGSFVSTLDENQFFIVSSLIILPQQTQIRHSVLDITNTSRYLKNSELVATPQASNSTRGPLDYTFANYSFRAPAEDAISHMTTWATGEGYSFNISWDATFTAMHNLGSGTFNFGAGNTSQWSLSACRTAGTLTIDGREYTIDSDNSLTWYDRQWGYGGPTNFTWFGLRFPESNISLSVWAIDYKTEATADEWRFATARTAHGDLVVPFTFKPGAGVWTSETTNFTYPSTWELEFRDGEKLVITAVRPDQELGTAFSGFVNVEGTFLGSRGESGVVDVIFT